MKLSHKTPELAARVFDLFMWIRYQMDVGEPVFDKLDKIRLDLESRYNRKLEVVTSDKISDNINCCAKLFISDKEAWSRVPSGMIIIASKYFSECTIDKLNLQEYIVQNLEEHNHSDKIPLVLSELENMNKLVSEALRRYENGINYRSENKNKVIEELELKNSKELYDDLMKGNKHD